MDIYFQLSVKILGLESQVAEVGGGGKGDWEELSFH